jgi:DNA polymerase-3 subunit epsilon
MGWATGPLLGFDTETTGVDVASDRIVTAALVHRDATGTRVRTWLLAPGVAMPPEAAAIHGISAEHAARFGRPPAQALEEIATAIADALRAGVPVVAYNAPFDLCLLEAELRRHGLPTLAERLHGRVQPVLDPLALDRCEDPAREGGRRLVDLCGVYRVVDPGRLHTADVDAVATLDLLTALVARFGHLDAVDPAALHARQAAAHRTWAAEHDARRAAEDRPGPATDPSWPVRTVTPVDRTGPTLLPTPLVEVA